MKRTLLVLAAIGALIGSGVAYSSLTAGGPSDDPFVVGGGRSGPGTFPSGFAIQARDFSVDAHVEKQGENLYGHLTTRRNGIGSVQTNVTCVSIDGNRAVVGGVETTSGFGRVVFLIDSGPPSSATRDQSSAWFVEPLDAPSWPDGFPYVCPTPDSDINGTGYLDIHSGDIVVSAGGDWVMSGRAGSPSDPARRCLLAIGGRCIPTTSGAAALAVACVSAASPAAGTSRRFAGSDTGCGFCRHGSALIPWP